MNTFVLIVMLSVGPTPEVIFHEFTSLQKCQDAAAQLIVNVKKVKVACVPK